MDQQLQLITCESDEALLLPSEMRCKAYTAEQCEKIEERAQMILALIGAGYPVEFITRICGVATRTVQALAGRHAEVIGNNLNLLSTVLMQKGAKYAVMADQKAHEESAKDLVTMSRLNLQSALELRVMGAAIMPEEALIEMTESNPALVAARAAAQRIVEQAQEKGSEP